MPKLIGFDIASYQERLEQIVSSAEAQIEDLASECRADLDTVERAAAAIEHDMLRSTCLWVQEIVVEGQAATSERNTRIELQIPDFAACNRVRQIKMHQFASREQYLPTGRYRAVVAMIRLDGDS